jgi:hypothetical protein|tara:strand:- start:11425 stop:11637 length:213 start_codon:yes stop_codon:yes gene_type:complete
MPTNKQKYKKTYGDLDSAFQRYLEEDENEKQRIIRKIKEGAKKEIAEEKRVSITPAPMGSAEWVRQQTEI